MISSKYPFKSILKLRNIKKILKKIQYSLFWDRVISLHHNQKNNGNVLISYAIHPFLKKNNPDYHVAAWESKFIADAWYNKGYDVDIIHSSNLRFIPNKKYDFFIDALSNMERLSPFLGNHCIKILHITESHRLFHNYAEYKRLIELKNRRNISLNPRRVKDGSSLIEYADIATIIGNKHTIQTYSYAKKKLFQLPVVSTIMHEDKDNKKYELIKNNYLWLGSTGLVHKGLDLVIEAFLDLPNYNLFICGPIQDEVDFELAYYSELYKTSNIHTIGWIDTNGEQFREILHKCLAIIYPSCSEGQAGSVINCMNGGLIPIISIESGIDVEDFGIQLFKSSISEIKGAILNLSSMTDKELKEKSNKSRRYVKENHSKETYQKKYSNFMEQVIKMREEL